MTTQSNNMGTAPVSSPGGNPSSARTKLILGIVVVVVLGIAAVGAVVYFGLGLYKTSSTSTVTQTQVIGGSQSATSTASTAVNPPETKLSDVFTFRNVFAPTVKPVIKTTATTTSSSTSTSTATASANTLYLLSIQMSPTKLATFMWNGQSYAVAEGGQVASSPWKVVTISSGSVLMLFGDAQVTVTVGQTISK